MERTTLHQPLSAEVKRTAPRKGAWLTRLACAVLLCAASGAQCQQFTTPTVRALPQAATREQVMALVNNNTDRVTQYYTTQASLSSPLFPSLRTNIAVERPHRFRLRAETAFTGPELDLGSNDELFWFWVRRNQPPALYFCRHAQFATSPARQMIPIEPTWLIEALGMTSFPPEEEHQGPFPVGSGRLRMVSLKQTQTGPLTKVTVVDESRGWVLEQHLYDERGVLLASALASDHRRDPLHEVTLPRTVEIQWPPAQLSLRIDVRNLEINSLGANTEHLWQRPVYEGFADFDLGDPNVQLQVPPLPGTGPPPGGGWSAGAAAAISPGQLGPAPGPRAPGGAQPRQAPAARFQSPSWR